MTTPSTRPSILNLIVEDTRNVRSVSFNLYLNVVSGFLQLVLLAIAGPSYIFIILGIVPLFLLIWSAIAARRRYENEQVQAAIKAAEDRERIEHLQQRIGVPEASVLASPRKGLIVLVSFGKYPTLAARDAIAFHRGPTSSLDTSPLLKHVWLIYTAKPHRLESDDRATSPEIDEPLDPEKEYPSWQNAGFLLQEFDGTGCRVHMEPIENEHDAFEVFKTSMRIYEQAQNDLGLGSDEIVADITGGTKPMSVGLALAGIPLERDLEYLQPNQTTPQGLMQPGYGSNALLININFLYRTRVMDREIVDLLERAQPDNVSP